MKRVFLTLLFAMTATVLNAQDASTPEYVIPFVLAGSEIYVMNGADPQTITIEAAGATKITESLGQYGSGFYPAAVAGPVRIRAGKPVVAWAEVAGTMIPAALLGSTGRLFLVTADTGIALHNPQNVPVRMTWYGFDRGRMAYFENFELKPGQQMVGFFKDLVDPAKFPLGLPSLMTIVVASEKSLDLAVTRCGFGRPTCSTVPVGSIGGNR